MPSITTSLWFDLAVVRPRCGSTSLWFDLAVVRRQRGGGGPHFQFTEAVSFVITCKDQDQVDYYWGRLTDGGEESQCGWCKDRFGLSWQVVPERLYELLGDPDPAAAAAATTAMLGMGRIVIAELEAAAAETARKPLLQ